MLKLGAGLDTVSIQEVQLGLKAGFKPEQIIFTPNGFLEQKPFDGNEWQRHVSGWEIDEMRQMGFDIIGINGWKPLRGPRARITIRPKSFWKRMSYLSELYVTKNPQFAFQILCVKNL